MKAESFLISTQIANQLKDRCIQEAHTKFLCEKYLKPTTSRAIVSQENGLIDFSKRPTHTNYQQMHRYEAEEQTARAIKNHEKPAYKTRAPVFRSFSRQGSSPSSPTMVKRKTGPKGLRLSL